MSTVFLDTSAWFAAMSSRQEHHAACLAEYRRLVERGLPLITTTMVVAEMHALLLSRASVALASTFLTILDDTSLEVLAPDLELVRNATSRWIRGYTDQSFSLCDAVSFEVMRKKRMRTAFSIDHHFAVAGFTRTPFA